MDKALLILGICLFSGFGSASAQLLASAEFADYSNGLLVGQNGWQQYNTASPQPIMVDSGTVSWSGNRTDNNQDAFLPFPFQVNQPDSGTTILHYDLLMAVTFAGSNPAYFAALNTFITSDTSGNFQNARLVAQANDTGFSFGVRVNGQGGYPFAYGLDMLEYGDFYAVRAEIHMVAGNANDFINLYVGPDFDSLTLHATAAYDGVGSVNDPSYGAMLLSQYGTSSVNEAGVTIESMSVTIIPEPSILALLAGAGLIGGILWRRRRA